MVDMLLDTNILVDMLRDYEPAIKWKNTLGDQIIGISNIVYMEMIEGSPNKHKLGIALKFLSQFALIYITEKDQQWAIQQHIKYNLSHNIDLTDALIASPAIRLNLRLYTRNIKHFLPIIPDLLEQPY